jgi:hypothetical protein
MSLTFGAPEVTNIFLGIIALVTLVMLFILYRIYQEKG